MQRSNFRNAIQALLNQRTPELSISEGGLLSLNEMSLGTVDGSVTRPNGLSLWKPGFSYSSLDPSTEEEILSSFIKIPVSVIDLVSKQKVALSDAIFVDGVYSSSVQNFQAGKFLVKFEDGTWGRDVLLRPKGGFQRSSQAGEGEEVDFLGVPLTKYPVCFFDENQETGFSDVVYYASVQAYASARNELCLGTPQRNCRNYAINGHVETDEKLSTPTYATSKIFLLQKNDDRRVFFESKTSYDVHRGAVLGSYVDTGSHDPIEYWESKGWTVQMLTDKDNEEMVLNFLR